MMTTIQQTANPIAPDTLNRYKSNEYPLDSREARINLAWNYKRRRDNPNEYSCRRFAGCLKNSGIFKEDAVVIQRKMRDAE
ncbi:hypothetical protein ACYULU_12440 [Breznakiellaceae bacterium SP9]